MLLAGLRMAAHQYIARKEFTSTPKGVFSSHHPRLSPSRPSKSFPHNQAHLGRLTILLPSLRETPSFRKGIAIATTTRPDRKSTRLNSSHVRISYAVFCLKKKKNKKKKKKRYKQVCRQR